MFWLLFSYFFSTALQVNYSILIWTKIKFHEFHILSTKMHIHIFPIIVLPTKKRACRIGKRVCLLVSWKGIEPPTYRLGVDPMRWNQVQHSARKSLEIQGFSLFQILSGITLHKHFHRDFTPSDWLEISKAFDFWWTLQVQANSSM